MRHTVIYMETENKVLKERNADKNDKPDCKKTDCSYMYAKVISKIENVVNEHDTILEELDNAKTRCIDLLNSVRELENANEILIDADSEEELLTLYRND